MRGSQKSLILVARQLGVHIGPNDIPERFKIDERELSLKEMCELANSFSLIFFIPDENTFAFFVLYVFSVFYNDFFAFNMTVRTH